MSKYMSLHDAHDRKKYHCISNAEKSLYYFPSFIEYFCKTIETFLKRANNDFVKNSLWEYLGIPMLRIRFDQIDYIDEMVIDLLSNPQNYISQHNTFLSEEEYWENYTEIKEQYELACA